jgi:DNA-directed RNA polymerase II subunit RPB2
MLPHVGVTEYCRTKKAFFLGYMVHKMLMCAMGRRGEDDRDHYGNKRLDLAGPLLGGLFRTLFRTLVKQVRQTCSLLLFVCSFVDWTKSFFFFFFSLQSKELIRKEIDRGKEFIVSKVIKHDTISKGLQYALATGNWGAGAKKRTGVSQVLNRLTFASSLSHLRRLTTPIGKDGKLAPPRQLHNTHWGVICPAETPEGQQCGLVKNLALMTHITGSSPVDVVMEFLSEAGLQTLDEITANMVGNTTKVFVNGAWVGVSQDAAFLAKWLRDKKRSGDIKPEVAIVRDVAEREVRVSSEAGRIARPLFVVENNRLTKYTRAIVRHEMVSV